MRSLALLTIISLLIVAKGGAQNYHRQISYEYLEILTFSLEFSYSNSGTYQPNAVFSLYGNALIALEERYKKNHAIISAEYYKLKDLEMINLYNRDILNTYRNARLQTIYQAGSTWDLSKSANASRLLEFCCEIYSYPSIKRELTLLKNCQNEIDRLKRVNPDGYPLTTRYRSILTVLEKLATCPPEDIGKLNWESVEIEMSSSNNFERSSDKSKSGNELIGYEIYVTSEKLNLRDAASTKSEVITTLHKGQSMDYIEEINDDWIKIRVKFWNSDTNTYDTEEGFVFREYTDYSHNQMLVESMLMFQKRD